ncbi:phage tail protein [Salmonella enterica]|nr:phage tail protein [Salmonella enterica]EBO9592357.1 phage tail protein [Salmonella enterica]EIE0340724.1 phage tail protein [Salmonella enterica]EJS4545977.1 phage tail protein [Salmonella enterica]EKN6855321.1 phage tail protein [Salmonella enterica]
MEEFDNLFDAAMARADNAILGVMGTVARVVSGALAGDTLAGVFDDPESVSYAAGGVRIEGVSPSLFVKSAAVRQLRRLDTLIIGERSYWVDRIGQEDGSGSRHIWLGTGEPPVDTRRR